MLWLRAYYSSSNECWNCSQWESYSINILHIRTWWQGTFNAQVLVKCWNLLATCCFSRLNGLLQKLAECKAWEISFWFSLLFLSFQKEILSFLSYFVYGIHFSLTRWKSNYCTWVHLRLAYPWDDGAKKDMPNWLENPIPVPDLNQQKLR